MLSLQSPVAPPSPSPPLAFLLRVLLPLLVTFFLSSFISSSSPSSAAFSPAFHLPLFFPPVSSSPEHVRAFITWLMSHPSSDEAVPGSLPCLHCLSSPIRLSANPQKENKEGPAHDRIGSRDSHPGGSYLEETSSTSTSTSPPPCSSLPAQHHNQPENLPATEKRLRPTIPSLQQGWPIELSDPECGLQLPARSLFAPL